MGIRNELKKTKKSRKFLTKYINKGNNTPNKPGLYVFLDKRNKPIYIGRTNTSIRDRVTQHIDPSHARGKIKSNFIQEIQGYDFLVCQDRKICRETELKLIRQYKPKFNKLSNGT